MQKVVDYKIVQVRKNGKVIVVQRAIYIDIGKGGTNTKDRTSLQTEILNSTGRKIA